MKERILTTVKILELYGEDAGTRYQVISYDEDGKEQYNIKEFMTLQEITKQMIIALEIPPILEPKGKLD